MKKNNQQSFIGKTRKRIMALLLSGTILGLGSPGFAAEPAAPAAPTPTPAEMCQTNTAVIDFNVVSSYSLVTKQNIEEAFTKLCVGSPTFRGMVDDALKDPNKKPNILVDVEDSLQPNVATGVYTSDDWTRASKENVDHGKSPLQAWPWSNKKDYVVAIATQDFTQYSIKVESSTSGQEVSETFEEIVSHEFEHIRQIQTGGATTDVNHLPREEDAVTFEDKIMYEYDPQRPSPHVRDHYGNLPVQDQKNSTTPHILAFPSSPPPINLNSTGTNSYLSPLQLQLNLNHAGFVPPEFAPLAALAPTVLLVIDLNHDGIITDHELFGTQWGYTAGFDALATLDTDGNGVITKADTHFNDLRVWIDTNRNGIPEPDELHTLSELGITSISTENSNYKSGGGVLVHTVRGTPGDDTVKDPYGKGWHGALIYGSVGNGHLIGGPSDNVFVGGPGNHTLSGGTGDDIYIYNIGDGNDTIIDSGGNDKIVFGVGIAPENLSFLRTPADDLEIGITTGSSTGKITIRQQFANAASAVEAIEFSNGSTINLLTQKYDTPPMPVTPQQQLVKVPPPGPM